MADPVAVRFGSVLRRFRLAAGLSQEKLAELASVSPRGISSLEAGHRASPRPETVRLLADALQLDDEARATLVAAARPELGAASGARASLTPPPEPPTRLVGREREVAAICGALRPDRAGSTFVRLLTLTGPGGAGKTRLALAAARELASAFDDGAAWVELASLGDAALVPSAIGQTLGLRDPSHGDVAAALIKALRPREALLILDNCEHLPAMAGFVASLIAACPHVTVLATSRARLQVRGEREFLVEPLAAPKPRGGDSGGLAAAADNMIGLASVASVRLFVDRASEASPGFMLTADNAIDVVEICRRLDGLPLALELAAARLKVLSPASLRSRLERRLPLLTGGARDQPARQQTMRAAIAWSYELIAPAERRLFQRLSVFAGGCRLEDAEIVAADADATTLDVLDGIAALVGQSLLRREMASDGAPRFAMLETVREYAQERLAESGQEEPVRDAHADYVLALAEQLEFAAMTPDGERQLARLEDDLANVRAALAWVEKRGDVERFLRLAGALGWFWFAHSHYREGAEALALALMRGADQPPALRAKAMIGLARIVSFRGESDRAEALFRDALAMLRAEGDALRTALALTGLGALSSHRRSYDQATTLLEEALALAESLAEPAQSAVAGIAHTNLGVAAQGSGRLEQARIHYEAALGRCRASGYVWGETRALRDLGDVARSSHDLHQAWTHYRDSLALAETCGDMRLTSDAFAGLATVGAAWGQPERAARLLGAAERLRDMAGAPVLLAADRATRDRCAAELRDALGAASFQAALTAGRSLSLSAAVREAFALEPPSEAPGVHRSSLDRMTPQ